MVLDKDRIAKNKTDILSVQSQIEEPLNICKENIGDLEVFVMQIDTFAKTLR